VRAGDDDVGAGGERVLGQARVEAQVRAPGLVDDEHDAAVVADLREPAHVSGGAEVGRAHDEGRGRAGCAVQRVGEVVGVHAVGDSQVLVDARHHERRLQAAEHEAVDRAGVHVALDDDLRAGPRQRQADRVAGLAGAVDEKPGAPGAPGRGGGPLRRLQRRLAAAEVDAVYARRYVEREPLAERGRELLARAGSALVAGDVEAAGVAAGVTLDGLEVRRRDGRCRTLGRGWRDGRRGHAIGSRQGPGSLDARIHANWGFARDCQ
jgi:hypothetical protein